MSIVAGDIKFYLSGGASNTNPNLSLGGTISTTQIVDNTLDNLFPDVTGDEHSAGYTSYRAFYIENTNATTTGYNVKIWIDTNTSGTDETINIGIEASSGSPKQTIVNETTAPTGISFSTAAGQANSLSLGTMAPGVVYMIWVERIVSAGTNPYANDSAVIKTYFDTP